MCEGSRIKKRREELGLTQDELAKKLGYKSRSSINKIELGERRLTQKKILTIATALDVSPLYILGIEEKPQTENYPLTIEERNIILAYRVANDITKDNVKKILDIKKNRRR